MSELDRLIAELCPDGVERKQLEDVIISLKTGLNPRKNFVLNTEDSKNYYVTVREIVNGKIVFFNKTDKVNDDALRLISNRSNLETGDVLFSGTGTVGRIAVVEETPFNWNVKEGVYVIKPNQELVKSRFIAYVLGSSLAIDAYSHKIVGSPVCSLPMTDLRKLSIPVPPLPIQREIVRILDNFTEFEAKLAAELTAELTARKKQYEYYRYELLTFGEDVPMVSLGEISEFKYGFTDKAKDHGSVRFIRITDISDNGKLQQTNCKYIDLTEESEKYLLKNGDLLMARTGATYGKTMLFTDDVQAVYASFLLRIRFAENTVLPAYYWHFSQSCLYWYQANKFVSKAGQPQFNANAIKNIKIPVPSIIEQKCIIGLLDRFDALTTDITYGLPAEIEARRRQYEYYRDKLLAFPAKQPIS